MSGGDWQIESLGFLWLLGTCKMPVSGSGSAFKTSCGRNFCTRLIGAQQPEEWLDLDSIFKDGSRYPLAIATQIPIILSIFRVDPSMSTNISQCYSSSKCVAGPQSSHRRNWSCGVWRNFELSQPGILGCGCWCRKQLRQRKTHANLGLEPPIQVEERDNMITINLKSSVFILHLGPWKRLSTIYGRCGW